MKKIPFHTLEITDKFWSERQNTARTKTVWAVYNRFYETGRIPTLDCSKENAEKYHPHIYWGSDVFKWIEGACYMLMLKPDPKLSDAVADCVDKIERGVREDGYYNTYYNTVAEPIYSKIHDHELYSLGHLIEAAVAHYTLTKSDRLLNIAIRATDHADRAFRLEKTAAFPFPGHEEIELALIKLYDITNEDRFLKLSKHFVDERGKQYDDAVLHKKFNNEQYQAHKPVREQTEAVGHAVRAVYLYCAIADLSARLDDAELFNVADRLFDDIYYKKMYITGGIGDESHGEKFTLPYHLPNLDAYTETCAALGLALFASRMSAIKQSAKYGDAAERAIFNGMTAGLSLDGDSFFYTNPLEMDKNYHKYAHVRQKVFGCSCCPPNLTRMIPSIGDLIYSEDQNYLYVHQYISNEGDGISIKGDYTGDGKMTVQSQNKNIALRLPSWCKDFKASAPYTQKDGYLYFDCKTVEIDFNIKPIFVSCSPLVRNNIGKVAVMRGPIVYCIESQDQPACVFDCKIDTNADITVSDQSYGTFPVLYAKGYTVSTNVQHLYSEYSKEQLTPCMLKLIPYYTFANRGADDMQVWITKK